MVHVNRREFGIRTIGWLVGVGAAIQLPAWTASGGSGLKGLRAQDSHVTLSPMAEAERDPWAVALGRRLQKAREGKKWSQAALGEFLGANQRTVSNWELGVTPPSAPQLFRLCLLLELDANEAMGLPERR